MDGFDCSSEALTTMAAGLDARAPTLTADSEDVASGLPVATGNPALDSLVDRLAGQVATSLAQAGAALAGDAEKLRQTGAAYCQADLANRPPAPAGR